MTRDMLGRPIRKGDDILIKFGKDDMLVCKVTNFAKNSNTIYVDCVDNGFNPLKCVVITNQIKSNLEEFPEYALWKEK